MPGDKHGVSLHIGLARVDSTKYPPDRNGNPWTGECSVCEADARDMAELAESQGFNATVLPTAEATADNILRKIREAAETLTEGDIFLLTFSGHGGNVDDTNSDEEDEMDETWVTYDRQLADDELYKELTQFKPGVRVVVLSDSCHSGTIARDDPQDERSKLLPKDIEDADLSQRGELYEQIQAENPDTEMSKERLQAEVLAMTACADDQEAKMGPWHSMFTGSLLAIWNRGQFQGSYRDFFTAVCNNLGDEQTPQWKPPKEIDPEFALHERPFTI